MLRSSPCGRCSQLRPELAHGREGFDVFLAERGVPEDIRRAILGHVPAAEVPRDNPMAQVLYAVDELSGFITAVALVRPSKSLSDLKPKSAKSKLKDKAFAAKVSREEIREGIAELGVDTTEHIAEVIEGMRTVAAEIGLDGRLA